MKKSAFLAMILILTTLFVSAQEKKMQLSFFTGLNHVFQYGSADDYEMGENDFPVTPAHTPFNFGAAFAFLYSDNIGFELDGRYILSSKVTLEDPSDQDTLEINTAKHFSVSLNVIYRFLSGKLRPYVVAGGGLDKYSAKEETYTSQYGYEIAFDTEENGKTDFLFNLGAGIQYSINNNIGTRLDLRYILIFDDPSNINNLNVVCGVVIKL